MHDSDPDDDFNVSLSSLSGRDSEAEQDTAAMPPSRDKGTKAASRTKRDKSLPSSSAHASKKKDALPLSKKTEKQSNVGKRKKSDAKDEEESAVASEKRVSRRSKPDPSLAEDEAPPTAAEKRKKTKEKNEEKKARKEESMNPKQDKKESKKEEKNGKETRELPSSSAEPHPAPGKKSKDKTKQATDETTAGRRPSRGAKKEHPAKKRTVGEALEPKSKRKALKNAAGIENSDKEEAPTATIMSPKDQKKALKRKSRDVSALEEDRNKAGPSEEVEIGESSRPRGKRSRGATAAVPPAAAPRVVARDEHTPVQRGGAASPDAATAGVSPRQPPQTSSPRNRQENRREKFPQPIVASTPVTDKRRQTGGLVGDEPSDDEVEEVRVVDGTQHAQHDVSAAGREWLMTAAMKPRSKEAAAAPIRKSLEGAVEFVIGNIEYSITNAENNSVLILGERGGGKTLAIERALGQISSKWNTDPEDPLIGIVRLYGWAHHDERVAFKEIARQLCDTFNLNFTNAASRYENLNFYREVLDGLARADKVAVFVLDEFDQFAGSKQTLLYNLLDALLVSGVRAVVLGTSVRHDVVEMLEKRVKSRFSHRKLDVQPPASVQAAAEEGDEAGPSSTLSPVVGSPGGQAPVGALGITVEASKESTIEVLQQMLTLPDAFPHKTHAKAHNKAVNKALKDPAVKKSIEEFAFVSNSLHELRNVVRTTLLASSAAPQGLVQAKAIIDACKQLNTGLIHGYEQIISGLSVLELIMLVSAFRAARRNEDDAINFEMAFAEFSMYTTSGEHVDTYSKSAASKAFYKLAEMGLVAPHGAQSSARVGSNSQFAPMDVLISIEELQTGISGHSVCPTRLKDWVRREGGPALGAAGLL